MRRALIIAGVVLAGVVIGSQLPLWVVALSVATFVAGFVVGALAVADIFEEAS